MNNLLVAVGISMLVVLGAKGISEVNFMEQFEVCQNACVGLKAQLTRHNFKPDECFCDGKLKRTF